MELRPEEAGQASTWEKSIPDRGRKRYESSKEACAPGIKSSSADKAEEEEEGAVLGNRVEEESRGHVIEGVTGHLCISCF